MTTTVSAPSAPAFARALDGIAAALAAARPGLVRRVDAEPAEPAAVEVVEVDEPAVDDCVSGSCQLARPGGPCDCACGGAQHGARSTLAPAACGGVGVLVDITPAGTRYPRCPGCPACDRATVAARVAPALAGRDPFAGLPTVDDDDLFGIGPVQRCTAERLAAINADNPLAALAG